MNYSIFTCAPDSGIPQECFPIDDSAAVVVAECTNDMLHLELGEIHTFEHHTFYGRMAFHNEWFRLTGQMSLGMQQS